MRKRHLLLLACLPFLATTSCRSLFQSSVSRVSDNTAEDRTFGQSVDDAGIYGAVTRYFAKSDVSGLLLNVTPRVYEGRVFLFGRVTQQVTADEAVRLAWLAKGVKEVINDIEVGQGGNFLDSTKDTALKTQISTRLLATKGVRSANYTVEVWDSVVYLIGTSQDQRELDAVTQIARTTGGVKKVVSHLKLKGDTAATPTNY